LGVAVLFAFVTLGFAQTTKTYIENLSGWESCSACAGRNGSGPTVPHTLTQGLPSPTMGSKSAEYWIGGSNSYGNALWWKNIGPGVKSTNFQYDIHFYLKNPSASQALEFDVVETSGGRHLVFGVQCELADHEFRIWSPTTHWTNTGIACPSPSAYKWHHLTMQYHRTSGGNAQFVSMTLDGVTHYINKTEVGKSSSGNTTNTSFQMDERRAATDYSTWVENLSVKWW
jgi:hypothetical protein